MNSPELLYGNCELLENGFQSDRGYQTSPSNIWAAAERRPELAHTKRQAYNRDDIKAGHPHRDQV